jgi:plastocyanin
VRTTVQPITTQETVAVEIKGLAFVPATITISKGTTVTWTQEDNVTHTVTGTGFDSGDLSQGKTFSYTFNEVGIFNYGCLYHPSMSGKIIVT